MRALLILHLLMLSVVGLADRLTLVNDDVITGKLVQMVDGELEFDSEFLGKIKVDWEDVKQFETTERIRAFRNIDENLLCDSLKYSLSGVSLSIHGSQFELDSDEITGLRMVPWPKEPPAKWEGALSSSLGLTQSNRDAQNFNLDFDVVRARATDRLTAKAAYAFANQSLSGGGSETTVDTWFTRGQYDVVVNDKFFWYGSLRFDRDRVSDLDLRSALGAGGGLTFWNGKKSQFRSTFGLSYLREEFTGGQQNSIVSLQFGSALRHEFNSWLTILHDTSYYPNPDDFGDYFLSSELVLRSALKSNMFAELKFVFDYDATPAPGAQQENYRYTMGVGMRF